MTDTPQKRRDAKSKIGKIGRQLFEDMLDTASSAGYHGFESVEIHAQDGVLMYAKKGGQQTHKN